MKTRAALLAMLWLITPVAAAESAGTAPGPRSLTFADRVRAQEAIERLYYAHQIGPTKPFEEAVPRDVIEAKVRRYLEESAALATAWKTPITDAALQRELERMSGETRMPERLQEIYAALGNDVFLIKECVARATLADRLTHNFYAYDPRLHTSTRAAIDALHDQLASGALSPKADHPNKTISEIAVGTGGEAVPGPAIDQRVSQADFDRKRAQLPGPLGQVSDVLESRDAFSVRVVLSETATTVRVASYVVPKIAFDSWWTSARGSFPADSVTAAASDRLRLPGLRKGATFDPAAPCTGDGWNNGILDDLPESRIQHSAVWTGSVMLVWGGWKSLVYLDSGGRYDPVTDTWQPMTTVNAPRGRIDHTAVWTGSEMIVWGGREANSNLWFVSGGRYDPIADRWTRTALGPSARRYHTAVWTGSRMIVWGGYFESNGQITNLNTGMLYDPSTDSWTPTATNGAPLGRYSHTAVWTGSEMIVWGGQSMWADGAGDGGRYDPATDAWSPMAGTLGRVSHSAVWTGTFMVVWGGYQFVRCSDCGPDAGYFQPSNTGDRYDPVHDRWIGMSVTGAPNPMSYQLAAWTGHFLFVIENDGHANAGGLYDPSTDHWTGVASDEASAPRQFASLVWTGHHAIVWGGARLGAQGPLYLNSGRRYDPWGDLWTPTSTGGPVSQRSGYSTVWTGNEMIVWGGAPLESQSDALDSGARYDPGTDSWTETTKQSAPAPRGGHTAVWSGDAMLIWGGGSSSGELNSGGRYDPGRDVWSSISEVDAPSARAVHVAVWTGRRMVVWGGFSGAQWFQDGGVYDPAIDQWTATTLVDAPSARQYPTAVWTGARMVIWGGIFGSPYDATNTGGRYDPETDTWSPTSIIGAPTPRPFHSAVWVGERMVVWGGGHQSYDLLNTGGRYDPVNDTWSPTTTVGAPPGHAFHAAVAAGNRMLLWGGLGSYGQSNTGGLYDVVGDRWTKFTKPGYVFPMSGTAVWTGEAMIFWDGIGGGRYFLGHSQDDDCDGDGVSAAAGDCDDHDPATYPGAPERCDGVANECARFSWPSVPTGQFPWDPTEFDDDRDGWLSCAGDCNDSNLYIHPGAAEACDGWDTDCDGQDPSLTEADADGDGYRICQGDCDDTQRWVHPGAYERCDGLDNDCDGEVDEGGDALCVANDGCLTATCEGAVGCTNFVFGDGSCDDGNQCTVDDRCFAGTCRGSGVPDGTPCDDGHACTVGDYCAVEYCYAGTPRDCGYDGNDCNGAEYCDYSTGNCAVNDFLRGCDDGNVCSDDSCDEATGCHHVNNAAACDDGNACTAGDLCADGLCQAGVAMTCDDGNPCTDDACVPWAGCTHTNHDGACDDGNVCTGHDACENGACVGHDPVACAGGDACHDAGACDPATGLCSLVAKPDGTACNDGDLCTTAESCRSGTCTPATSGLTEPNPRTDGYYQGLCHAPHSGDQLTDADALCVGSLVRTFAGISTVADLCAELVPSQPNNDPCDRTEDDLITLALNLCRARVCAAQGIDSQCGSNGSVAQSLAEIDAILSAASRTDATCAQAKCLAEEINTGRALELDSLSLRLEAGAVRLMWQAPFLDDGTARAARYNVWRRVRGSLTPFTKVGTMTEPSFLDSQAAAGSFEYEVTAVMQ